MKNFIYVIIGSFILGCAHQPPESKVIQYEQTEEWNAYWYAGVAELTTYKLNQVRYGEMREGYAAAVFVTEDFSRSRHVKLDYPDKAGNDKVSVLKFNLNKKFITGIYDYVVMQSTFKPVDVSTDPHAIRVTTSNIEWCGQFLTSARLKNNKYEVNYQSYFDGEEDKTLELKKTVLEDEIWNWIRISPQTLPIGEIEMIPSILTQELTHQKLMVQKANCKLTKKDSIHSYEIEYKDLNRKLIINFDATFPYGIESWEETFSTVKGWGLNSKVMTTSAKRVKSTRSKYWAQKNLKDEVLRKEKLGITDGTKVE